MEEGSCNEIAAIDVLSHAIQLDHYAEEAFRRLMAIQGRIGRHDSIATTWRELQRNLANLELDPEPATFRLHQELTSVQELADTNKTGRQ